MPDKKIRRWILAGLSAAMILFLGLLIRQLAWGDFWQGLGAKAPLPQPGPLADAGASFERWREPEEGELSFWACESARFGNRYAVGTLRFENAAASPYTLVFELTARVEGRERIVYRSPRIPPGYCLDGGKLRAPLKEGTYRAVCVAYAYLEGGKEPVGCSEGTEVEVVVEG